MQKRKAGNIHMEEVMGAQARELPVRGLAGILSVLLGIMLIADQTFLQAMGRFLDMPLVQAEEMTDEFSGNVQGGLSGRGFGGTGCMDLVSAAHAVSEGTGLSLKDALPESSGADLVLPHEPSGREVLARALISEDMQPQTEGNGQWAAKPAVSGTRTEAWEETSVAAPEHLPEPSAVAAEESIPEIAAQDTQVQETPSDGLIPSDSGEPSVIASDETPDILTVSGADNPSDAEKNVREPVFVKPDAVKPAPAKPEAIEPTPAEPNAVKPAPAEPDVIEPTPEESAPAKKDMAGSDPAKPAGTGADSAEPDKIVPENPTQDSTMQEPALPDPENPVPGTSEDVPSEIAGDEGGESAPASCFLLDEAGMLYGFLPEYAEIADGCLYLPAECTGIRSGSFSGCGAGIVELYIPAGAAVIETGAFSGLDSLEWIEVEEGNLSYASGSGVLFDSTMSVLVKFPSGRLFAYAIPPYVVSVADGAFEGASISRLDIRNCPDISLGENAFGYSGGSGIEIIAPREEL